MERKTALLPKQFLFKPNFRTHTMKNSIFASSVKTVLALLVSASVFSVGCDAVTPAGENPDNTPNSFTANIDDSGQKRQLKGAAAMGSRGWDGSGGIFTVSDDWCADGDHDSDYTFFTIELMPGDDNPLSESIYFFYEGGVPQPGTYDIADYSFAFDSTAWNDDGSLPDFTNQFVASYSRMPDDNNWEYSFGTGGTLTINEITDANVEGTFNFVSNQCISFDFGSGTDSLNVDWQPNIVDKDLMIDGEFNISLFNDNGDGGGGDVDSTNSSIADALKELAQQ